MIVYVSIVSTSQMFICINIPGLEIGQIVYLSSGQHEAKVHLFVQEFQCPLLCDCLVVLAVNNYDFLRTTSTGEPLI